MTRVLFLDPHWGWLWCIPGLLPNGYWHSFTGRARNWPHTQVAQLCNQELQNLNFSPHIYNHQRSNNWMGWASGTYWRAEQSTWCFSQECCRKKWLERDSFLGRRLLQSIINHCVGTMWMRFIYSYHSKEALFSRRGRKLPDLLRDNQLIQNCAPWSQL